MLVRNKLICSYSDALVWFPLLCISFRIEVYVRWICTLLCWLYWSTHFPLLDVWTISVLAVSWLFSKTKKEKQIEARPQKILSSRKELRQVLMSFLVNTLAVASNVSYFLYYRKTTISNIGSLDPTRRKWWKRLSNKQFIKGENENLRCLAYLQIFSGRYFSFWDTL